MPHHPKVHSMTKKLGKLPKQKIKTTAKKYGKKIIAVPKQEMGAQILAEKLTKTTARKFQEPLQEMGHSMTKKLEKLPKQKIIESAKKQGKEIIQEAMQSISGGVAERAAEKLGRKNPIDMKYGKGPHMGHSPAEMGHSPAEMGHSPAEMESAKQERKNLLQDNPVAKHASWLSKHAAQSRMGSPLKGHCMGD